MYLEITTPIQISPLQFCLICDKSYVSDLITTLQMVGLVLGATISGQIADIYGEIICVCVCACACACACVSTYSDLSLFC